MEKEQRESRSGEKFTEELANLGIELNEHQKEQFDQYYELLVEWNKVMNLTGITEYEEVNLKHFTDSLSIARVKDMHQVQSVIDIGTGEISIHAEKMTLLSKSLQMLPEKFHGLTDTDTRYRQRYVDLIMNADSKDTFIKRSKILAAIRKYLSGRRSLVQILCFKGVYCSFT